MIAAAMICKVLLFPTSSCIIRSIYIFLIIHIYNIVHSTMYYQNCIYIYIHSTISSCSIIGFPESSIGKESASNAGEPCSISGSGRSTGEGKGYPLQYSGLENSMDCEAHGLTKSWTQLSNFHSLQLHYYFLYFQ